MQPWKEKIHDVIFEADTKAGKAFDVLLLVFILSSLLVVMLDSVLVLHLNEDTNQYIHDTLDKIEWFFTNKTERFQFTTKDGVLEKSGVLSSISKKYFGDKFDVDKFITGTPKFQEKELQVKIVF